ncbi:hypothetical protein B0T21DRAFT_369444 [Apiosordaria backusii]|uniref:Uncharacterized protein n=1 Tax=Apiosordaria backusii TaxID=314023 RepID=A0AA40BED6_9PEZI|nr:hypothetical protein B0T21DRAFT_369444 [Apiosordaria backusii]
MPPRARKTVTLITPPAHDHNHDHPHHHPASHSTYIPSLTILNMLTLLLSSRPGRAVLAAPLLYLSYYCNAKFNRETLMEIIPPILDKGVIPHPTHPVPILDGVFGWKIADDVFRPISVMFSPSTMGIDEIAWWQMVFFLTDLGPVYVVWLLEGMRGGNKWTAAYLATTWNFICQIFGIGVLGPVYCWLHFVFSPRAEVLVRDEGKRGLKGEYIPFLLPLLLVMHYGWVYLMFFGESMEERHYWTWMWQPAPLWIGVVNAILAKIIPTGWAKGNRLFSAGALSLVVGGISMGMWWYVILKSEFSLWEIFVPAGGKEKEFAVVAREILQYDLLCSFGGLLVWLFGLMTDLWAAGAVKLGELLGGFVIVAVAGVLGGPGVAVLDAWWWREKRLQRFAKEKKN